MCGLHNVPRRSRAKRERLFAQHVLAGFKRGNALFGMQGRRHAQVHEVHLGVRQHFGESAIDLYLAAQVDVTRTGDVAHHARQHAINRQPH